MAFFEFGNTTLELIEPDDQPELLARLLDRNGPGFHHIAFKVKRNEDKIDAASRKTDYPLLQKGEFTGGRYAYVDTEPQLGAMIELLEFDKAKEAQP